MDRDQVRSVSDTREVSESYDSDSSSGTQESVNSENEVNGAGERIVYKRLEFTNCAYPTLSDGEVSSEELDEVSLITSNFVSKVVLLDI
jgi:hypothetical protein